MEFTLYGKILSYNEDMEQYVKIRRKFLSIFSTAKYNDLIQLKNPGAITFEKYLTTIVDIYKKYTEEGINTAISVLYENGMKYADENDFIARYMDKNFSIDVRIEPLVQDIEEIYRQYETARSNNELEIASRSRWSGGGFGLTGAVKGAITAKALNVGMDFFHSFGDNNHAEQLSKDFRVKQYKLLNKTSTYQMVEDSVLYCITGLFNSTIEELQQNAILRNLVLEPQKAKALFKNSVKYEKINFQGLKNLAVECLQMDPFFQEIYIYLLRYDPENENLITLARYFDTYPNIEKKIEELTKVINEMSSSSADNILMKLEKCIKLENLYNVRLAVDAVSKETMPQKIAYELLEFCKRDSLNDLNKCIKTLKELQGLTNEDDFGYEIDILENMLGTNKQEKSDTKYAGESNQCVYLEVEKCIKLLKETERDIGYKIFKEIKKANEITEDKDLPIESILKLLEDNCEIIINNKLLRVIKMEFSDLNISKRTINGCFASNKEYHDYWAEVKTFLDAIKRLMQSVPEKKIKYKKDLSELLLEYTAYFMNHSTNEVLYDGNNKKTVKLSKSLYIHISDYLRGLAIIKDGKVHDNYRKQKDIEDYWDEYERQLEKNTSKNEKKEMNQKVVDKKEGCYIATAVYGSYEAPEVLVLREFRDKVLKKSFLGRIFIKVYYTFSPYIAIKMKKMKHINQIAKIILDIWVRHLRGKSRS